MRGFRKPKWDAIRETCDLGCKKQESAIDFVLMNGKMRESVTQMWIYEDRMIDIVLDYNMFLM